MYLVKSQNQKGKMYVYILFPPDFLDHIFTLYAFLLSFEFVPYFARQESYILQEYSGLLHT